MLEGGGGVGLKVMGSDVLENEGSKWEHGQGGLWRSRQGQRKGIIPMNTVDYAAQWLLINFSCMTGLWITGGANVSVSYRGYMLCVVLKMGYCRKLDCWKVCILTLLYTCKVFLIFVTKRHSQVCPSPLVSSLMLASCMKPLVQGLLQDGDFPTLLPGSICFTTVGTRWTFGLIQQESSNAVMFLSDSLVFPSAAKGRTLIS